MARRSVSKTVGHPADLPDSHKACLQESWLAYLQTCQPPSGVSGWLRCLIESWQAGQPANRTVSLPDSKPESLPGCRLKILLASWLASR
jgi:hypothetical protein